MNKCILTDCAFRDINASLADVTFDFTDGVNLYHDVTGVLFE